MRTKAICVVLRSHLQRGVGPYRSDDRIDLLSTVPHPLVKMQQQRDIRLLKPELIQID
jgi:hypothetical protein